VTLLNNLYSNEWRLFFNFFIPSVKLLTKTRDGSKTFKSYDLPKTPYQRLLESSFIPPQSKEKLQTFYKNLNPFSLRQSIESKLKIIFKFSKHLASAPSIGYPYGKGLL